MDSLTDQLVSSNQRAKELEDKMNYQEDYSRRKNLRISCMEEHNGGETWEQTAAAVGSLLENKLEMSGLELQRHDSTPRTVVVRFNRFCDREAVMRNSQHNRLLRLLKSTY